MTPSGTIARWNLDETTGSTAIDSIGTLDGVYTGAVVQGGDPAPDTSYYGGNGFSGDASDNLSIDFAFSEVTQDFGDWNGSGALTTTTSSTKDPNLRLGAVTDAEATVSPNSLATADDLTGVDDEDGVTMPTSIILGSQVVLPVVVSNTTGASAYLHAWIDFNNDGAFDNALISNGGERWNWRGKLSAVFWMRSKMSRSPFQRERVLGRNVACVFGSPIRRLQPRLELLALVKLRTMWLPLRVRW